MTLLAISLEVRRRASWAAQRPQRATNSRVWTVYGVQEGSNRRQGEDEARGGEARKVGIGQRRKTVQPKWRKRG